MTPARGLIRWIGGWAGVLACVIGPLHAAPITVVTDDLDANEVAATTHLIEVAATRMPPRLMAALPSDTRVEWRELPEQVHGRTRGSRVGLQGELLAGWMTTRATAGESASPAVRALIHELGHRFDRSAHGGVSRDPRFRDLAGWPRTPWPWGGRGARNGFVDRSPDAYELSSPREFFAVNLEYFVLDPEYACRRPALYRYFVERFEWQPAHAACPITLPFVEPRDGSAASLAALDPARVAAIDYLLADANAQPMSRWGHGMLRLVICAPGRPRGPECRLDLAYHRVLSFRAFVGDVQISSWRGLTGSYPSRLFLLPLDQVIDDYTRTELRGLKSIPLRLDDAEIAAIVERAAQMHWSYDGRYYFLGNNCAVETWRLLTDSVPRLSRARLRGITPNGLLDRLERAGIADASVLDDPIEARRLGYYFEPASARHAAMFDIARTRLHITVDDADAWLALEPTERRRWFSGADLQASAALLVLEEAARRQQELRARDMLKRRLLDGDAASNAEVAGVRAWLEQSGFLSRPAQIAPDGYGIPQAIERDRIGVEVERRGMSLDAQDRALREQARAWLGESQRRTLDDIDRNLAVIGQQLRDQSTRAN